jgi:4-amino-4-deoxy-L-arabinose transferase-like glycosyltransferase
MSTVVPAPPVPKPDQSERALRLILTVFALVAGTLILGHLAILVWAQNSFTGGECVVAAHSSMLAHDGTLYYDFHHQPYTVAPYTPLFYLLDAGLQKIGFPLYTAGRAISFAAALGIAALSWFLTLLYTNDRRSAALAALLCASSSLLFIWGTVGQVDVLALFWALAAFYLYSRYSRLAENRLILAAACALLAFFTKQTMLACPAAICLHLFFTGRKSTAVKFALGCLAVAAAVVLPLDRALHGRFLADTVFGNINPLALSKFTAQLRFTLLASGPLILVAALGAKKAIARTGAAPFLYLALAALVFLGSAARIGSDLNYQLEFTAVLIVCSALSLHALDFFALSLSRTRTWVTLLQLPLGVFLLVNYRTTAPLLVSRVAGEMQNRAEVAAIRNTLSAGPVLSADYNAVVRLRGRLDCEMAFYNLLVSVGAVDPGPLRRDIAAGRFSTIILLEDVRTPHPPLDIEISTLPAAELDEIRKHYALVKRIPAPVLDGMYVYKPFASASH